MHKTIETRRLILRPLEERDLVPLASALNNFRIVRNTASIPWPYVLDDALSFARGLATTTADWRRLVISPRENSAEVMGVIGLDADVPRSVAEIGYWLAESHWGQGYGLEAARAIVAYGFSACGHDRLIAVYRHGNEGSRRILDRLGFRLTGHGRNYSKGTGTFVPVALLELTRREWDPRR